VAERRVKRRGGRGKGREDREQREGWRAKRGEQQGDE